MSQSSDDIIIPRLNSSYNESTSGSESETEYPFTELEEVTQTRSTVLLDRINSLKDLVEKLKEQIYNEKEQWQNETKETMALVERIQNMRKEEEKRASQMMKCQHENIFKTQTMQRIKIQKEIALTNFRNRLMEVENMCNLELLRVKQNVQTLQPLQQMVSQWNKEICAINSSEICRDQDLQKEEELNRSITEPETISLNNESTTSSSISESIGSKFYNEMNEMFDKVAGHFTNSSSWKNEEDIKIDVTCQ